MFITKARYHEINSAIPSYVLVLCSIGGLLLKQTYLLPLSGSMEKFMVVIMCTSWGAGQGGGR